MRRYIIKITSSHQESVFASLLSRSFMLTSKQTPVSQSAYFVHMDSTIFPNPHSFNPDRWIEAAKEGIKLDRFLVSFSKGSRQCLGIKYDGPSIPSHPFTLLSLPCPVTIQLRYPSADRDSHTQLGSRRTVHNDSADRAQLRHGSVRDNGRGCGGLSCATRGSSKAWSGWSQGDRHVQ